MFFFLKPIIWAIKLFLLIVFAAVVYVVISGVQVVQASSAPAAPSADAIVVTGSGTAGSPNPNPDLVARLQQAVALYQGHVAPTIVVAGPTSGSGTTPIPSSAATWLRGAAIPASAIVQIPTPNASEFSAVATSLGRNRSIVIVTDAVNALWARGAAASAGLTATVSPPPATKRMFFTELGPVLREATGVAVGRIIGNGRAGWAAA